MGFKLEGVIPALVTPFDSEGNIDKDGLIRNLDFLRESGVSSVVVCGTTGESSSLTHQERYQLIKICLEHAKLPVIAGTGASSTQETLELTTQAQDLGADAALISTPYYVKPTPWGLYQHYSELSSRLDIPIILYNIPSRTGVNLDPETVIKLSRLEGIIGIKESSGDLKQVAQIIHGCSQDFRLVSGDDMLTLPIIALGGVGVISVAANIAPSQMVELVNAALKGDFQKARQMHYKLLPLFQALFIETNPIPIKRALQLCGLSAGNPRLPLTPLSPKNESKLIQALQELELIKEGSSEK